MADHEKIAALIAEISRQHGVTLSADDPLMILQTINAMLLGESADAQEEQLKAFKSELEDMSNRWLIAITDKAESVLNAALDASEAAMNERMEAAAKAIIKEVGEHIGTGLQKPLNDGRAVANRNLLASGLTLIAALVVLAAALFHH